MKMIRKSNIELFQSLIFILSAAFGFMVCIGWIVDVKIFTSLYPGFPAMKFNTALIFLILGTTLLLVQSNYRNKIQICTPLIIITGVIAFITFLQQPLKINLGIDNLLFNQIEANVKAPGRMSQSTALCFSLNAMAILLILYKRLLTVAQYILHISTIIALVAMIGYLYDVPSLHKLASLNAMAIHTSFLLTGLGIALSLYIPDRGFTVIFMGNEMGSIMARKLFPRLLIALLILTFLRIISHRYELVSVEFGIILLMVSFILVGLFLLKDVSQKINKIDKNKSLITESLKNFENAITSSSIISRADLTGKILFVNNNFEAISGYSSKELVGQSHNIINSSFHPKSFWINMWRTISSGKIWREEVKNKAKDGSYYWVDTFIMPFKNANGEVIEFLSIRNDITARKKAEERIKENSKTIEAILNGITDGFFVTDKDLRFTRVNNTFANMANKKPEEMIGHRVEDLFPYIKETELLQRYKNAITTMKSDTIEYASTLRPDNIYSIDIYPNELGLFIFYKEISQSKKAELEIKSLNESLRQSNLELESRVKERTYELENAKINLENLALSLTKHNQKLKSFIHIVSHNLRSHTVNQTYLMEYLVDATEEDERKMIMSKLKNVVDNLSNTLDTLVEIIKIDEAKDIDKTDVSLLEIFNKTKELLGPSLREANADIEHNFEFETQHYPKVYLESIFLNLISNSIKYRNPKNKLLIQVESRMDSEGKKLIFKDNGLGIDMVRNGNKVFGLNKTFHRHPQAKGVGLFITKAQIESMGGVIHLNSSENQGTEVIINFNPNYEKSRLHMVN